MKNRKNVMLNLFQHLIHERSRNKFGMTVIIAFLVFIGLFPAKAFASDFSLGVYPPILQIQATVPTIISKDITVVNASNNVQEVTIVLRPFTTSSTNNGQVLYLPEGTKMAPDQDIFQKVQILDNGTPVTSLSLAPQQKRTVTLRIGLPKDEPGADYYFSILFVSRPEADQPLAENSSHITAAIGANVLLSIGPKDQTTGFLQEFSTPWFATQGPIPFTVEVANTSRHFIAPNGQILIRNMFGQLIGKVALQQVNILGNSSRFIPALWNEKLLFGPYRANIVVSLSREGPILTQTIYFFVMPIQYIIAFFIAIVILSIVISRVKKRVKQI